MTDPDLESAYDIDGPDAAKALYRDWADSYDQSFGETMGYVAPREIAALFRALCDDHTPVLDVGAGTGLVAEHLTDLVLDGIDISPEMLEAAAQKGLYRHRITADLTLPLDLPVARYGGVLSCGTFTHGHVGPEALPELLRVARPGALFVCGTRAAVYDGAGFGSALAGHVAARRITPVDFHDIPIYEGVDHPNAQDRALVMVFHKS